MLSDCNDWAPDQRLVITLSDIFFFFRAQELCESGGGRPGLPVANSPYGLCGRKATLNFKICVVRCAQPANADSDSWPSQNTFD